MRGSSSRADAISCEDRSAFFRSASTAKARTNDSTQPAPLARGRYRAYRMARSAARETSPSSRQPITRDGRSPHVRTRNRSADAGTNCRQSLKASAGRGARWTCQGHAPASCARGRASCARAGVAWRHARADGRLASHSPHRVPRHRCELQPGNAIPCPSPISRTALVSGERARCVDQDGGPSDEAPGCLHAAEMGSRSASGTSRPASCRQKSP